MLALSQTCHCVAQAYQPSRFQLGMSRVQMGERCLLDCRSSGKPFMKEMSSELRTFLSRQLTLHAALLQCLAAVRASRIDRASATYKPWYFTVLSLEVSLLKNVCLHIRMRTSGPIGVLQCSVMFLCAIAHSQLILQQACDGMHTCV